MEVSSSLRSGDFTSAAITALATAAELNVANATRLWISFTTTVNLTDFNVDFKFDINGAYVNIGTAAADYTAPEGPILGASGDLASAATGSTHWINLDVSGVHTVRIQVASTAAVVAGHYGMN